MSKIINVDFQDVNDRSKFYSKGSDVSHIEGETLKFLTENKYIDEANGSESEDTGDKHLSAKELIEKINQAETAEDVDALITEDETRATVLKAAEARKTELQSD